MKFMLKFTLDRLRFPLYTEDMMLLAFVFLHEQFTAKYGSEAALITIGASVTAL